MNFVRHEKGFCEECHKNAEPAFKKNVGEKFVITLCTACIYAWFGSIKKLIEGEK